MILGDIAHSFPGLVKYGFTLLCDMMIFGEILGLGSSLSAIALENQALTNNVHEFVHETPGI